MEVTLLPGFWSFWEWLPLVGAFLFREDAFFEPKAMSANSRYRLLGAIPAGSNALSPDELAGRGAIHNFEEATGLLGLGFLGMLTTTSI